MQLAPHAFLGGASYKLKKQGTLLQTKSLFLAYSHGVE